jgi:hypothetical protein
MTPMNEPFDPTKPVQCRNGRKARIICADAKHQNFPIVALVDRDGAGECPVNFTKDGLEFIGRDSDLDLINTPPPPRMNEPFDPTKPFTTRDGRRARLLGEIKNNLYPLCVAVKDRHTDLESVLVFTRTGQCLSYQETDADLINTAPPPREIWVNEYEDGSFAAHLTKDSADRSWLKHRLRCVRFVEAK